MKMRAARVATGHSQKRTHCCGRLDKTKVFRSPERTERAFAARVFSEEPIPASTYGFFDLWLPRLPAPFSPEPNSGARRTWRLIASDTPAFPWAQPRSKCPVRSMRYDPSLVAARSSGIAPGWDIIAIARRILNAHLYHLATVM
jgi:hypothetical protein